MALGPIRGLVMLAILLTTAPFSATGSQITPPTSASPSQQPHEIPIGNSDTKENASTFDGIGEKPDMKDSEGNPVDGSDNRSASVKVENSDGEDSAVEQDDDESASVKVGNSDSEDSAVDKDNGDERKVIETDDINGINNINNGVNAKDKDGNETVNDDSGKHNGSEVNTNSDSDNEDENGKYNEYDDEYDYSGDYDDLDDDYSDSGDDNSGSGDYYDYNYDYYDNDYDDYDYSYDHGSGSGDDYNYSYDYESGDYHDDDYDYESGDYDYDLGSGNSDYSNSNSTIPMLPPHKHHLITGNQDARIEVEKDNQVYMFLKVDENFDPKNYSLRLTNDTQLLFDLDRNDDVLLVSSTENEVDYGPGFSLYSSHDINGTTEKAVLFLEAGKANVGHEEYHNASIEMNERHTFLLNASKDANNTEQEPIALLDIEYVESNNGDVQDTNTEDDFLSNETGDINNDETTVGNESSKIKENNSTGESYENSVENQQNTTQTWNNTEEKLTSINPKLPDEADISLGWISITLSTDDATTILPENFTDDSESFAHKSDSESKYEHNLKSEYDYQSPSESANLYNVIPTNDANYSSTDENKYEYHILQDTKNSSDRINKSESDEDDVYDTNIILTMSDEELRVFLENHTDVIEEENEEYELGTIEDETDNMTVGLIANSNEAREKNVTSEANLMQSKNQTDTELSLEKRKRAANLDADLHQIYKRIITSGGLSAQEKLDLATLERLRRTVDSFGGTDALGNNPVYHHIVKRQITATEACGSFSKRRRRRETQTETAGVGTRLKRGVSNVGRRLEMGNPGFRQLYNQYKNMCNFIAMVAFEK